MRLIHVGLRLFHVLDETDAIVFEGTQTECKQFIEWHSQQEDTCRSIVQAQIAHYLMEV